MPSSAALDKIIGAAPNDHLDVDQGEGTFLNTREWKYATFFNRVKQAVGRNWDPNEPLRQRDPTGRDLRRPRPVHHPQRDARERRAGEGHPGPALERRGLPRRGGHRRASAARSPSPTRRRV